MSTERNKDVVQRFDTLTTVGGDVGDLDELCAPDMVNHALAPGRPQGIEGTKAFLIASDRSAHPVRWEWSVLIAEGDYVIQFGALSGEWSGGSFRGFSVPPGPYTRDVAFMYRLEDGRIAERWAVRDDLALLLQRGTLTSQQA